jgi:hypothetical protein
MKSLRFKTKISPSGTIQIPDHKEFFEKDVEITIVPLEKSGHKPLSTDKFLKQWAGFLKGAEPEISKYDYLSEKYK